MNPNECRCGILSKLFGNGGGEQIEVHLDCFRSLDENCGGMISNVKSSTQRMIDPNGDVDLALHTVTLTSESGRQQFIIHPFMTFIATGRL